MIPVLICIPVLVNGRPGYTCFLPNIIVLLIHTLLLCLLVIVSVLVNAIDTELNIGYLLHCLTTLCTLAFLTLAVMGYRRLSSRLLMAAFCAWSVTWLGYLLIAMISVSNTESLEVTSVNGRCPINFWIFDWCKKVQSLRPDKKNETTKLQEEKMISVYEQQMTLNFNRLQEQRSLKENESSFTYKSVVEIALPVSHSEISLTDIGGYQTYTSSLEHKKQLGYITGIFLVMIAIMYLYTMYGYVLLKILNHAKTTPIFIITRIPHSDQEGQNNQNEEPNQTQNDKII